MDDPGRPINKPQVWLANYDLSSMELRCRNTAALLGTTHEHRQVRGHMYVECQGRLSISEHSGTYTSQLGAVFGKACKAFVDSAERMDKTKRPPTALRKLADESGVVAAKGCPAVEAGGRETLDSPQYLLLGNGACVDLVGEASRIGTQE